MRTEDIGGPSVSALLNFNWSRGISDLIRGPFLAVNWMPNSDILTQAPTVLFQNFANIVHLFN